MKPTRITIWRTATLALVGAFGLTLGTSPSAEAQTFTVLHTFAGYPTDGAVPEAGLLMDASGNLYGTTTFGGNVNLTSCDYASTGCGTVFKLDTSGVETVLHNFDGPDGANPLSNLILDAKGDLYGTTRFGGITKGCNGCGVVFKLSGRKETVLHRFCSVGTYCTDGAFPPAGVIMDASGALYGTTNAGGTSGNGVVFKLVGTKETVLHSFTGGKDGGYLTSGLLLDAKGNLYGTDAFGGDINCDYPGGCGVVFKLTGKQLRVLHSFKGPPDGAEPFAGLMMDSEENLYGTTKDGGIQGNLGTVFKVSQAGKENVLYRFKREQNGFNPSGLVRDGQGNLYGTNEEGGLVGAGVVFEITTDGKEKILHEFCTGDGPCSDGLYPNGLIMDAQGNLYGTAAAGGDYRNGTIFKITLPPTHPQ
jgi:uncharacterized repeat protein (TIGR03803 family)